MKCLFLAAGYATRLYPLTENFPKPLLEVQGKAILDWLIDDLERTGVVDEYIVVSNHKFAHCFDEWVAAMPAARGGKITIVDDGTSSNETRLGAVKDIQFAIDQMNSNSVKANISEGAAKNSCDDMLVLAGDNLMEFSLQKFVDYVSKKQTSCVMRYYIEPMEILVKHGVVTVDENDKVTGMKEKSPNPPSHWCCPALYYFRAADLARIPEAMADGCGTDAPGSFVAWLCQKTDVYAMEMPASPYDIGNMESYQKAQQEYRGTNNFD